jgi:aldehyde:ferredoxin oxidoreductase
LGAVMGSKKLKAIALRGTGKPLVVDDEALKIAASTVRELVKQSLYAGAISQYGTQSSLISGPGLGDVPVQNYSSSKWKGMNNLDPNAIQAKGAKKHACFNCPVACTSVLEQNGKTIRVPEYETLAMLGTNILVDDLDKIIQWNILVNDLGMDTISLGVSIASLLEAIERNLTIGAVPEDIGITKTQDPEKGEIYSVWGMPTVIDKLIPLIAHREGIGNDLADGVRKFMKKYDLPDDLATHAKGLEVPAHEPRASNLTALDYATSSRGAYHCFMPMLLSSNMNFKTEIGLDKIVDRFGAEGPEATVDTVIKMQDAAEAYSACGGCIFGFQSLSTIGPWVDALNAITGHEWTVESWMKAGAAIFNLKRRYNEKCGISKSDDIIGARFFKSIEKGGTKKNVPPLDQLLPIYYQQRGWD